jgi:heptosyltransferase-2
MNGRRINVGEIKRVVVRGTNWVGDAVMTVPALRELRRVLPDAHITLATRSWANGIFADADFIDNILVYDRKPRDLRAVISQTMEWRKRSFDLAVLFQNAFEAAVIASLAGVMNRIGYATDGRRAFLTNPLKVPAWHDQRHEIFYYLNVVAELERAITGESRILEHEPRFDLVVSDERKEEAHRMLEKHGATRGRTLVTICPGSINSRAKRWPADRFAQLADRYVDELNADVALIGSAEELTVSRHVAEQMKHRPIMLTGETRISQAVAILSLADLLVTNDTGPAHIASALGRPTLVIFGPTNPLTTRPFSPTAEVIRQPPECAPCMLRDCPIDHRCMTAISSDEVFERAVTMLKPIKTEVVG